MSQLKRISMLLLLVVWLSFFGGTVWAASSLEVIAGIAPYTYLAEKIGGSNVTVHTLIGQSQNPHTFEPSPKQVLSLGGAHVFLLSGLDFEGRLVDKIQSSFPSLNFVNLSKGLVPEHCTDEHDHNEEHDDDCDQHLWLSPPILKIQAERVAEAFAQKDPANKNFYYDNLDNFQKELEGITKRIATQLKPFQGRSFFVFHPAFGNFGAAFGLHQKAVETSGRVPTPKKIANLIAAAKKEEAQIIFVQPQFDQASAKIMAASIGGAVVALDPLAKDVLGNLSIIASHLERAFH